jgi:hypothetical protein
MDWQLRAKWRNVKTVQASDDLELDEFLVAPTLQPAPLVVV